VFIQLTEQKSGNTNSTLLANGTIFHQTSE